MGGRISTQNESIYQSIRSFCKFSKPTNDVDDGYVVVKEEITPIQATVTLEDIDFVDEDNSLKALAEYCLPLVETSFAGQTNSDDHVRKYFLFKLVNQCMFGHFELYFCKLAEIFHTIISSKVLGVQIIRFLFS